MVKHLPVVKEEMNDCKYGLKDKTPTTFVDAVVVEVATEPSSTAKDPEYVAVGAALICTGNGIAGKPDVVVLTMPTYVDEEVSTFQ